MYVQANHLYDIVMQVCTAVLLFLWGGQDILMLATLNRQLFETVHAITGGWL